MLLRFLQSIFITSAFVIFWQEIGRKFGGRDHTTVMHAVKKVEELKEKDISLAEDLDLLKRMLQT